jgi:hypothetical protein
VLLDNIASPQLAPKIRIKCGIKGLLRKTIIGTLILALLAFLVFGKEEDDRCQIDKGENGLSSGKH